MKKTPDYYEGFVPTAKATHHCTQIQNGGSCFRLWPSYCYATELCNASMNTAKSCNSVGFSQNKINVRIKKIVTNEPTFMNRESNTNFQRSVLNFGNCSADSGEAYLRVVVSPRLRTFSYFCSELML